jgi:hypothetical protein
VTAPIQSNWWAIGFGLVAVRMIAAVDNVLFEGEVSPIVTVGPLLGTTITAGQCGAGGDGWPPFSPS